MKTQPGISVTCIKVRKVSMTRDMISIWSSKAIAEIKVERRTGAKLIPGFIRTHCTLDSIRTACNNQQSNTQAAKDSVYRLRAEVSHVVSCFRIGREKEKMQPMLQDLSNLKFDTRAFQARYACMV